MSVIFFFSRFRNHKSTNNCTYLPRFLHRLDNTSGTTATFIFVVHVDIADGVPSLVMERLYTPWESKKKKQFWALDFDKQLLDSPYLSY